MTSSRKNKLRSAVLFGFLGLALIAMVITGFGTDGMGGLGGMGGQSAATVFEVEGEEVTDAEVSRRMSNAYRELARQQPGLERGQFFQTSFDPLLDQLIDTKVLAAFARDLGFVVPESMVNQVIVGGPFRDVAGQFDQGAFQQYLQDQGLTERQMREDIANTQLMRMVLEPVGGGARIPNGVAAEYANLLLEGRTGQLGAVPAQLLAAGLQPTDQEIARFYQQNQRLFALPERRVLRFALIGREQLGDAVRATDQEVAAFYQQNQAQYGPGETRNLQVFISQDEAAARRLVDQVRGGTNFLQAAQAAGFAPEDVNLANQTRQQFTQRTSQEVANAAFGAQAGTVLGPFRTPLGFQVVRVEGINRTAGRPLEAVRAEIAAAIEQRKLAEQLNQKITAIEEMLSDGASFEEVVQAQRLQAQSTPPMTSAGAGPNFQFPQELAPLLQAAFEFSPEDDPQLEDIRPDQQIALFQVGSVLPPAAPPLEQIRDQVRARVIQQSALHRAKAIADTVVGRINGGMAPAQAYAQAGIRLPPPQTVNLRRFQIGQQGQEVPPPLRILFSIPEGRARVIAAPNNSGWIIVHHQRRTPGNAASDPNGAGLIRTAQQELSQVAEQELQDQFVRAVRGTVSIERNEERIEALRQQLRSGQ